MVNIWETEWIIPGTRLVSGANTREHHMVRWKRGAKQKRDAFIHTSARCQKLRPGETCVVTITRLGVRKLDSDNLAISAKAVRDGIAAALGVDDGEEGPGGVYEWRYAQQKEKFYAVRVQVQIQGRLAA